MSTLGHSAIFKWNAQTVAKLRNIGGVEFTSESIDVTTHQSSDYYREFIQGLIDAGEFPVEGDFYPSDSNGQIAMLTDMNSRTQRECTLTLPNSIATLTFNGFLTRWSIGAAASDGTIPFSATVKITGKPTLAVATSTGLTTPFFAVSESGTISPNPAGDVYEYVVNFLTGVASFTITPTAAAGTIEIEANGAKQTVASGQASSAIALGEADSFIDVKIKVTETNKAPVVYTLHCCRA